MNFDLVDLIRSIIIGQSICMALLEVFYTYLVIAWRKPRPGSMISWISSAVGNLAGDVFVVLVMIDRINTGATLHIWTVLAGTYVIAGNLGASLLVAHIVLHNQSLRERISHWLSQKYQPSEKIEFAREGKQP